MPAVESPMRSVLVALLLSACAPALTGTAPLVEGVLDTAPVAVEVASAVGVGSVVVPVRVVNAWGVAVPAGEVTVAVEGADITEAVVPIGPDGHGLLALRGVPGRLRVTATASSDGATLGPAAESVIFPSPLAGIGLAPAAPLPAVPSGAEVSWMAEGSAGVALAADNEVWWQPADAAAPAWRVAALPFTVAGLQAEHVDNDGILDLLAWSGADLVVLRGLPFGGYAWGAGYASLGGAIVGVRAADLTGDRLADLAIATSTAERGGVEILEGDGAWGFARWSTLDVGTEIRSMTAADEDGDGEPEVSILSAGSGWIERFTREGGAWVGAATYQLNAYEALEGSRLLPAADLDGDGRPETTIVGPPTASSMDLVFYVIGNEVSTHYPLAFQEFTASAADLDRNGATDLLALDAGGTLNVVRAAGEGFLIDSLDGFAAPGALASTWRPGDAVATVATVATGDGALLFHPGTADPEGGWDRTPFGWRSYSTALEGPMLTKDIDADGLTDIIGFQRDGGDLTLTAWRGTADATGATQFSIIGRTALTGAAGALDLVSCGQDVWALAGDANASQVVRVRFSRDGDRLVLDRLAERDVAGTLLACGVTTNAEVGVAVAATTGAWTLYGPGLGGARDDGDAGAMGDFVLIDQDGDGSGEIVTCAGADCRIVSLDLDGDGATEVVRVGDGGATLRLPDGSERELGLGGAPSVGDIDSDGLDDLLLTDTASSRIAALRGLGGDLAPPVWFHTPRALAGAVLTADADGDGWLEIFAVNDAGELIHTGRTTAP
jgi:hypothetical protein